MIEFGSVYLIAKDFHKSLAFYKALLQRDVDAQNMTRFAIFNLNGLCLAIYNGYFDRENPDKVVHGGAFHARYDDTVLIAEAPNPGKTVLNLGTPDLAQEYRRITELGLGTRITPIRYVNAGMPYYYFSMEDPDGNTIEITGGYNGKGL